MYEPLYAALVFGKHCFVGIVVLLECTQCSRLVKGCGVSDAFWVDYALRLRMCEQCYKAK